MAKGKIGFWLEGWKFGLYLLIPISASYYFDNPDTQRRIQDYWKFVQYPANPNTGMKEAIEEASRMQKQREIYQQQLKLLQTQSSTSNVTPDEHQQGWRLVRWLGSWRQQSKSDNCNNNGETAQ